MKDTYYKNHTTEIFTVDKKNSYYAASHLHSLMEISYCFSGTQLVKIGDTLYELNEGDAILIFPYAIHEYLPAQKQSDSQTRSMALLCNINTLSPHFPELVTSTPVSPIIRASSVSKTVSDAFSNVMKSSSTTELIGWTYIILSNLLKQVELSNRRNFDGSELPASILAYINDNFSEEISIKTLSKKFAYSQSHIVHIFCDHLKIPFKTYLNSVRCEYAAKQLISTEKNIASIASESGYNSINTFCRCFKSHFKKTPSQYKKEYSNKKKQLTCQQNNG